MRALIPADRAGELVVIGEITAPEPTGHEALIRVSDFSLNRADYLQLAVPGTGFRPGIDAAGVVERAAADGSGPAAGSRVVMHLPGGGAAAEYVAAPADRLAVVPEEVSPAIASTLPLAGFVARRLLAAAGDVAGRRILATGVGGGVGLILIQLARAEGAGVTAVSPSRLPSEHIAKAGADVVHDIGELLDGSFDIVMESVGGELGSAATGKLRPGGLFLWFGQSSGAPLTLDFFRLLQAGRSLTLHHFVYSDGDGSRDAADMTALLDLVRRGSLDIEVGCQGSWRRTATVLSAMAEGELRGKAVLAID
jgi:NADPH:quinone reductase